MEVSGTYLSFRSGVSLSILLLVIKYHKINDFPLQTYTTTPIPYTVINSHNRGSTMQHNL